VKGPAEEKLQMKFLFEKVGAALGIAEIFGDIATGLDLKGNGTALKGGVETENALAMGVVKALGNADHSSKTARDALVIVGKPGISGMMAVGVSLAVMVAHDGSNDMTVAPFQAGDIAVEGKVLAVLVVAAMTDTMANVVKERAGFQLNASLHR
jgi:hypothetical protein